MPDCIACKERLGTKKRFVREITKRAYKICSHCGRAQPHSILFDPPGSADIGAASIMFERFQILRNEVFLKILVWGPDPNSDTPEANKRKEVRSSLREAGHEAYFSEDLIFDKTYKVPANLQESIQVGEMDAVICILSDFGAAQEAQEHGRLAREFLLWLRDAARGKYTDLGMAQQLRYQDRPPIFFREDDLNSCVVATASLEWAEQRRMKYVAIEAERKRLDQMSPRRKG